MIDANKLKQAAIKFSKLDFTDKIQMPPGII